MAAAAAVAAAGAAAAADGAAAVGIGSRRAPDMSVGGTSSCGGCSAPASGGRRAMRPSRSRCVVGCLGGIAAEAAAPAGRRSGSGERKPGAGAGAGVLAGIGAVGLVLARLGEGGGGGDGGFRQLRRAHAYKLYVPSGVQRARRCRWCSCCMAARRIPISSPRGRSMNAVAEAHGFFALYPDEPSSAQSLKCWQWFDPAHQKRGSGEPAALVALVDHVAVCVCGRRRAHLRGGLVGGGGDERDPRRDLSRSLLGDRRRRRARVRGGDEPRRRRRRRSSTAGPIRRCRATLAATAMAGVARPVRVIVVQGSADAIVAPVNGDQVAAAVGDDRCDARRDGARDGGCNDDRRQVAGGRQSVHRRRAGARGCRR